MSMAEEILPPSHRRKLPPPGVVLIHRARRLKPRSLSRSHFSAFLPVWPGSSTFLRPTCAIRLGGAGIKPIRLQITIFWIGGGGGGLLEEARKELTWTHAVPPRRVLETAVHQERLRHRYNEDYPREDVG